MDAINMGAYSYLTKPCNPLALRHALTRGLERKRLILDLRDRNEALVTDINISRTMAGRYEAVSTAFRLGIILSGQAHRLLDFPVPP